MTSRVTDLDRAIAANLRKLREEAKLTQPHVAGHLGITYQSYQKMEGGKHSFRASTLDRLGQLYNCHLSTLTGIERHSVDPYTTKVTLIMGEMSAEGREAALDTVRKMKRKYPA